MADLNKAKRNPFLKSGKKEEKNRIQARKKIDKTDEYSKK